MAASPSLICGMIVRIQKHRASQLAYRRALGNLEGDTVQACMEAAEKALHSLLHALVDSVSRHGSMHLICQSPVLHSLVVMQPRWELNLVLVSLHVQCRSVSKH